MKIKNKGKVYPSPSSSSSSSSSSNGDYLSVLKLLPAAILALASVLSPEDREVLAYLITRSIKTTTATASSSSIVQRKASKKAATGSSSNSNNNNNHKPPVFDCDCFDCYTSYWFRWDSSPNRELIHQAIEAFEDHLTNGEAPDKLSNKKNGKAKRRDKTARRSSDNNNQLLVVEGAKESSSGPAAPAPAASSPENVLPPAPLTSPENEARLLEENEAAAAADVSAESTAVVGEGQMPSVLPSPLPASSSSDKGLARKVLPDVLGLFNSRLWSLWSPNA